MNGTTVTYTFGANAAGTSNADHLAAIVSIAAVNLISPGADYRPEIFDQEARPINTGPVPIQGTLVVISGRNATCSNAEPSDFTGAALADPKTRLTVALEYIPRGRSGRVQVRGWINAEQIVGDGAAAAVGDGFIVKTVEGVHGALQYAGPNGAALKCIQDSVNDGLGR